MDTWEFLLQGFGVALQPGVLIYVVLGVLVGNVVGILPGLGPVPTIALLLPLTFTLGPTEAIVLLAGVYYGAMYGGSIPSILLRMPGESAAVMTMMDGYPMTQKGRGAAAMGMAAFASFFGGTVSLIGLTLLAPELASVALSFGPAEYTALLLAGLMLVSSLTGNSVLRGLVSVVLGLMIGTVGIDVNSGQDRYTGGIFYLFEGIDFAVAAIGLFAISEVLYAVTEPQMMSGRKPYRRLREMIPTREDFRYSLAPMSRSSLLGFTAGVLPGAGATLASFLAYGTERKIARRRKLFGTGVIEGVAVPESANNAATGGSMVPMLTLGIPGSSVTALLLTAMVAQGVQPGPLTFVEQPTLVWGLIASMYIGNIMLLIINVPFIGAWIQLLRLPGSFLYTMVGVLAVIGAYSVRLQLFEIWMMLAFGLLGYAMRRMDFPLAPLILALVLGPLLESNARRALTISRGDLSIFVSSGISIGLLLVGLVFLFLPVLLSLLGAKGGVEHVAEDLAATPETVARSAEKS